MHHILHDHPDIDASDIDVEAKDGIVTLSGEVPDRRTKWLAEDISEHIFGVKEVHNEIRVTRVA